MRFLSYLKVLFLLATSALAEDARKDPTSPWDRTKPCAGAVVVDNSAKPVTHSFSTLQAGISALSSNTTKPQTLFIYPGTYNIQTFIPALSSPLTIQGYTPDAKNYTNNTVTLTYNLALENTTTDDLTATLRVWNNNTKVYNLNVANTFGHVSHNGQNLAVSAYVGNQGYYGCQFLGYQDTVLASTGKQLYAKCLITGAIDFIFGQTALAWFTKTDIRTIATGCVTASGRATADNPSWYIISNSSITGINSSIAPSSNYLGRPWHNFSRVVIQDTYLGDVIKPAGWSIWNVGDERISNVTYAEYGNYGPGSVEVVGVSARANFSVQLTEPVTMEGILGRGFREEWWVDEDYL